MGWGWGRVARVYSDVRLMGMLERIGGAGGGGVVRLWAKRLYSSALRLVFSLIMRMIIIIIVWTLETASASQGAESKTHRVQNERTHEPNNGFL